MFENKIQNTSNVLYSEMRYWKQEWSAWRQEIPMKKSLFKFLQEENKRKESNGLVGCPVKTWCFKNILLIPCMKNIITNMILKQIILMQRGNIKLGKSPKESLNPTHWRACSLIFLSTYQNRLSEIAKHCLPLATESRKVYEKNEMDNKLRKEEEHNLIRLT